MMQTLRGRRYRIERIAPRAHDEPADCGECDAPTLPGKAIRLRADLRGRALTDAAIHEALHACLWDLDEEAVTETATAVTALLARLDLIREDT